MRKLNGDQIVDTSESIVSYKQKRHTWFWWLILGCGVYYAYNNWQKHVSNLLKPAAPIAQMANVAAGSGATARGGDAAFRRYLELHAPPTTMPAQAPTWKLPQFEAVRSDGQRIFIRPYGSSVGFWVPFGVDYLGGVFTEGRLGYVEFGQSGPHTRTPVRFSSSGSGFSGNGGSVDNVTNQ